MATVATADRMGVIICTVVHGLPLETSATSNVIQQWFVTAWERITHDSRADIECGVGRIRLGHNCPWWKIHDVDTWKRRVVYVQRVGTAALSPLIERRQHATPVGHQAGTP